MAPLPIEEDPDGGTEVDPEDAASPLNHSLASAYLVCRFEDRVEVVELTEGVDVVVGRAEDATIRVDSARASRRHARIRLEAGVIVVEDLGSRNGTRVNSQVLRSGSTRIATTAVLGIGTLEIVAARTERALDYQAPLGDEDEDSARASDAIVVADPIMTKLYQVLRRVAVTPSTVLVLGETGVGKEIVAARVHSMSARARGPFVRLNCASMPETLLESELFGHERGAFTGALKRRAGYFEAAGGGTLMLDEIGEMPLSLQAKLLRVLEQRSITRLGGTEEVPVDVRFVCATNRNLTEEVAAGRFRQDLYYRISTFVLEVPPLRERRAEILLLADLFARRFANEARVVAPRIGPEAVAVLESHDWPGNLRELRNAIEYAVVMADGGVVQPEHLPKTLQPARGGASPSEAPPSIRSAVEDVERGAILEALAAEGNNHTRAAKRLGISRRALLYKLSKYKLRG